jgi:hypothetical protein
MNMESLLRIALATFLGACLALWLLSVYLVVAEASTFVKESVTEKWK